MNEDILTKAIGNKEIKKLEEKDVTVVHATVDEKGEKKNLLLSLSVKHPDKEELINLSQVQLIDGKNVKTVGLWVNLDEDKNIQKGSVLNKFMDFYKIKVLTELKDLILHTVYDTKGYLCIKAY